MEITRQDSFNLTFYEIKRGIDILRIGVAGIEDNSPGASVFYPESGYYYIIVIFDNGWYKFHTNEFTNEAGLEYIAEKLKCSLGDAKIIREFISDLFATPEVAKALLVDNRKHETKNPYLPGYRG